MGGSQSKTETVFSRFPKETELLDSLKITPAVMERINNAQAPNQQLAEAQLAQQQELIRFCLMFLRRILKVILLPIVGFTQPPLKHYV